jgi:elongation factor G
MTQGRAIYTMQFLHYAQLPKSVEDEIVEKTQSNKVSSV